MASEEGVPVDLYIYDLTAGLACVLSPAIIGHQIDGVWHTSIVVFDREYFYGGGGVTSCAPGTTALGSPRQTERLGTTFVPFQLFLDYLQTLGSSTYSGAAYHLLEHNCNHFSDEVAQFLCGARVPKHIVAQADLLPPALRAPIAALLDSAAPQAAQVIYGEGALARRRGGEREDSPEFLTLNNQIEEARIQSAELEQRRSTLAEKLARKERKKEKKRKKMLKEQQRLGISGEGDQLEEDDEMAECLETVQQQQEQLESSAGPSVDVMLEERDERRQQEEQRRAKDPPIVYKDLDGAQEFEKLVKALEKVELIEEEKASVEELRQYLVAGEGSWVLGDEFLAFIGRLLQDPGVSSECRVSALRCMSCCALRDDVSLILHQDRRHHAIMNYAQQIDSHPIEEQCALALFMCNLFENISSSEWLLYISEWEANGQQLSNIRITTKVAVHALLSEDATLRDVGTALMHNVATKEVKTVVFDEICVELCMALLQVLGGAPGEEHLYRACKALAKLAHHSQEVPQLVAMVGPHPNAFRGTSSRVDEQIDLIEMKVK